MIEEAPLQIYYSALIFAPEKSIVRGQFEKQIPKWICIQPKIQNKWNSALQTLEGHSDRVNSVAFSPNGSKLASASIDQTVRIWDVGTGQVEQTLMGHSLWVRSVTFSPDGSKLASASSDRTVQIWDVGTGQVEQTLEGLSDWVNSVAFSPDDSKSRPFYSVDMSGRWVTQNGSRILYLPWDHRPGYVATVATRGSILAIGTATGRVMFMTFHSDSKAELIPL